MIAGTCPAGRASAAGREEGDVDIVGKGSRGGFKDGEGAG